MVSSGIALLPKPLASDQLALGQFLTKPLHPEADSFVSVVSSEVEELSDCFIHARYKDLFSLDSEGRFAQSYGAKFDLGKVWRQQNLLAVHAEQMISRTLENPVEAFEMICGDPEAREWILGMSMAGHEHLYFVCGIKELKKARFKRAKLGGGGIGDKLLETPIERGARVPRSVKVKDVTSSSSGSDEPCLSGVFGLDIRKVTARLNYPQEPHALEDMSYSWTYHMVPDSSKASGYSHKQLMIGLGDPVTSDELRSMFDPEEDDVALTLDAISTLSEHALSTTHSPMLRADSPVFRGRSPSPLPPALRM